MKIERRASPAIELRAEDGAVRVRGHAAVFNEEADIGGWFREVIRPGAFARALRENDVPLLIEHQGLPLARNTSGTLMLSEDSRGLLIESDLDASDPDVMSVVPKMKRGDLSKMSFAFEATDQKWHEQEGKLPLREILECRLYDVAIVTTPAYEGTDIGIRSLNDWRAEQEAARRKQNFQAASLRIRLSRSLDLKSRINVG